MSDSLVPVGGERFVSFNATLGTTFWSKPAIPKEALEELPVAFEILETHPRAQFIRNALALEFTTKTQSYREQIATVDSVGLEKDLLGLQQLLTSISATSITPETRALRHKCVSDIKEALALVELFKEKIVFENGKFVTTNVDARPELFELAIETMDEDTGAKQNGYLLLIVKGVAGMISQADPGLVSVLPDLERHRASMQMFHDSLKGKYETFEREGLPLAQANALSFLRDLHAQIDKIGRELNVFSLGPIFMFDAARLNTGNRKDGFRYGVGAGLQVELLGGLQLSGGYSWHPHRRPGEPRGAVVFAFNVSAWLP